MGFEEELIEQVKDHEMIYNLKHKDYKITKKKDAIWVKIGKKLGRSDAVCKKRWKSLRDGYRKNRNKIHLQSNSGSADDLFKKWKYFDLLKFLDDYKFQRSDIDDSGNGSQLSQINSVIEDAIIYSLNDADILNSTSYVDSSSASRSEKPRYEDISNVLKGAAEAIEKISTTMNQNSPLVTHLMSLGQRIERAEISEREKLIIEQEVSQWILQRLLDLEKN